MERPINNPTRRARKKHEWRSPDTKARAAQAGAANLAAYRARVQKPAQTHGVASFLSTGEAPPEIAQKLADFERGLMSDIGSDATTAQRALVENARIAMGVALLAFSYLQQGMSKLGKNRWVLQTLATYLNSLRLTLVTLGLERRAKTAEITVESVLKEYGSNGQ